MSVRAGEPACAEARRSESSALGNRFSVAGAWTGRVEASGAVETAFRFQKDSGKPQSVFGTGEARSDVRYES